VEDLKGEMDYIIGIESGVHRLGVYIDGGLVGTC
jgi:non-canonical (house-cleaning) NTP pyrophosphatase